MTEPEWQHVQSAIGKLSEEQQHEIQSRLAALRQDTTRPITCPFLHEGACSIYEARPIACRTYGFYVERDKGLYCGIIEQLDTTDVVWGNAVSVDEAMTAFGPTRTLLEWTTLD